MGYSRVAEFERELIRERVVAGMKEAGRQRKHCWRSAKEFDVSKAAELPQAGFILAQAGIGNGHADASLVAEISHATHL
ncbi:MAG: hypothetical protein JXR49_23505 [Acidobacteria bacterium]|nr:hypothetical protein [Acidobacteriota bacterium]